MHLALLIRYKKRLCINIIIIMTSYLVDRNILVFETFADNNEMMLSPFFCRLNIIKKMRNGRYSNCSRKQ